MPRAKPAPKVPMAMITDDAPEDSTVTIHVDSFIGLRDSVVNGLARIQDAIQSISSAYIKHTNAVLGEQAVGINIDAALSKLGENSLLGGLDALRAPSPARSPVAGAGAGVGNNNAGEGVRAKKKRTVDPNAPKRPLTPYFLYMQTARPIIAEDLGPGVPRGTVSTEGVRRWANMAPHDKALWTSAYSDNLRLYNARMHSYKAGNPLARDMSDEEALIYADEHHVTNNPDRTADGQLVAEALIDAPGEDDDEMPPAPAMTPKSKPASRRSKAGAPASSSAATPAAAAIAAIVPPPAARAVAATPVTDSPNNKRKRAGKKVADEPVASIEREEAANAAAANAANATTESSKGAKPRKKKAKGE